MRGLDEEMMKIYDRIFGISVIIDAKGRNCLHHCLFNGNIRGAIWILKNSTTNNKYNLLSQEDMVCNIYIYIYDYI